MRKDARRLLRAAERQGARLLWRDSCVLVLAPDGVSVVTLHHTDSDHRALKNARAELRRAGLQV